LRIDKKGQTLPAELNKVKFDILSILPFDFSV